MGKTLVANTNFSRSSEIGMSWTPGKVVSLAAMAHFGKEQSAGLTRTELPAAFQLEGQRNLLDAVLTINATEKLTFEWRLSSRGEYFDDKQEYRTGVVQKWKEGTLTPAWLPTKPIELRGEGRRDRSNVASFLERDGVTGRNGNTSYGLPFLYTL